MRRAIGKSQRGFTLKEVREVTKGIGKSQRGFTLIELLAVMAIIGVLAAIVVPVISGTKGASTDAQLQQDATMVNTAASDFFKSQAGAEVITPKTVLVTASLNGTSTSAVDQEQKISSRWPEMYISSDATSTDAVYSNEFPLTEGATVRRVNIVDKDGTAIDAGTLLEGYTAIDFGVLTGTTATSADSRSTAYMSETPAAVDRLNNTFHDTLWMLKKTTSAGGSGANDSRQIVVFKLNVIDKDESGGRVVLNYEQAF